MPSIYVSQQRHENMAAIHGRNTKPEMVVRKWLWGHGFRYRLNHSRLPGKPDIVMRKYRTCIFVNGCFWHGHNVSLAPTPSPKGEGSKQIESSECCKIPKTNREFWVQHELASMGWHCITVWECELKLSKREDTLKSLAYTLNKIFLQDRAVRQYEIPEEEPMMAAEDTPEYNNNR